MYYTIAQVAEKYGMTAHTLRYYDKEGLLPFVERTDSGTRKFKEKDFEWLAIINCLKDTGMSVKQIKQFIDWCQKGESTFEKRLNLFLDQKKQVEEQIAVLNKHMEKIDYKIWYYKTAIKHGKEALNCNKKCLKEYEKDLAFKKQAPSKKAKKKA